MANNKTSQKGVTPYKPKNSFEKSQEWAKNLVGQMTLEEKTSLIGGEEIFFTKGIPRLNIPRTFFVDATQGINLRESFQEYTYELPLEKSTAMSSPILLASTWNKQFAHDYAKAIGEECQAGGIPVLLGPGMNIYRISQCGRNFEYFGEDPYLVARMIENYVVGLQNTGTIATLKHFVANNTDYFRRKSNSILDERSLHEIYMPAFKAGIEAGALAVMTSYNLVHGEWAGESDYVINNLLRKQLGFKWLVMTDWWSVWNGEKVIKSGMDLEMPASDATNNALELVKEDKVLETDIDRMATSLLTTMKAIEGFNRKKKTELLDRIPKHEQKALEIAREGVVLLRNNNHTLPVKEEITEILVTGPYAKKLAAGGGAATVEGFNNITLLEALNKVFGNRIVYKESPSADEIKNAEMVLLCIGTFDSEGHDRPFDLDEDQETLCRETCTLNPNSVVIVNSGSGINMSGWNKKAAAILYAWYPGQIGNLATTEILIGNVNPSGKLPFTIEKQFEDSPGFGYIPKGEELYSGWNDDGEKARDVYDVHYTEGVFVGYRWYEKKNIQPLYAFGHGLSYTSFAMDLLSIQTKANQEVEIRLEIKNTGNIAGAEVAQVYVSDLESSHLRPIKELKGFEKVVLDPNESTEICFCLDKVDFSYWNPDTKDWYFEPGKFEILIGNASDNIVSSKQITLTEI